MTKFEQHRIMITPDFLGKRFGWRMEIDTAMQRLFSIIDYFFIMSSAIRITE
jgi:hypothetical protein